MGSKEREKEYLRRAEQAEAEAERTDDYAAKQLYLEMARQWRELAAQVRQKSDCP